MSWYVNNKNFNTKFSKKSFIFGNMERKEMIFIESDDN